MRRALLLLTLVSGCSFPDPTIDETAGSDSSVDSMAVADSALAETSDATLEDATTDAQTDVDATSDVLVDTKPSDVKAEVNLCETSNPCDCDGDGDEAKRTGCSGNDCDDGDKRRNSKVTAFQDYPITGVTHGGDWDCSMGVNREYAVGVNCSGLSIAGCAGQGYRETTVTCGANATYVRCKSNGLGCVEDPSATTTLVVKCK